MKALIYKEPHQVELVDRAAPKILDPTDIILRVTTTTICGTDMHVINGGVPDTPLGIVLGHEAVGVVEDVGDAVRSVSVGDRVVATAMSACGSCWYCKKGLYGQCANGGWALGHKIDGVQAEFARIPFANNSAYRIPDELSDEQVIFLTDILITGFEVGVVSGQVSPGDVLAVVGAGPVGLSTIITAQLYSPAVIVSVEPIDSRRKLALDLGATHAVDPSEARQLIAELTDGQGADVSIEAAGFPAPFELAATLVRPGGRVANIGVHEKPVQLHLEELWAKQVTLTTGIPSSVTAPKLLRAIQSGALDTTRLITHRLPLQSIVEGYDLFRNASTSGAIKVILNSDGA